MMKAPSKLTPSEVAKALPLPKRGEVIKGKKVLATWGMEGKEGSYLIGVVFEKGTKRKDIPSMLQKLFKAHHLTTSKGDYSITNRDYRVVPTREKEVQMVMELQLTPAVYNNPGKKKQLTPLEDFDENYEKMAMEHPEKYFRVFKSPGFNTPAYRSKLWTFVGYMGENYGYSDDENIYHRRASLVMPKIKITKAPIGAKMMYHTHPRKDEPSLSSADDYLLYFDLSMPPRSIRHFFTVMADRMDYFHITPKKDAKGKYVRISEDKFIDELDAQMTEFEKKHDAKYKKGTMQDDLKFCEAITRDVVKWLNKKYKDYVTIKYKCYYKVRKNPPEPEFDDLHLGDEFIAKAIQDIRDGEYTWPEFGTDKKPQENYAYWFTQYYFMEDDRDRQLKLLTLQDGRKEIQWAAKHRTKQLGLGPSRLNVINHYLDSMPHSEYSNYDMLNLLSLHYDIMASDESIRDGVGSKSRIEDMAKEMEIPEEVRDNLVMIEEARSLGSYTEEAKTLSGDFYPLLILSQLSIDAVQIMKSVENGLMSIEQARHDVYHRAKDRALRAIDEFLIGYQSNFNRNDREVLGLQIPGNFRGARLNPPPFVRKTEFSASIAKEDLLMVDIVKEALEKFAPYETGGTYHSAKDILYMIIPAGGTAVKVSLSLTKGGMQIFVPAKDHPVPEDSSLAAMEAYEEVIRTLNEYGLNVANENLEIANMVAANPRGKSQLILIAGPSGAGKSTTIRNLLQGLPNSKTVPTYTTRQKRKSDKAGEKVFVSEKEFKEMDSKGEFAESVRQKNGNFYGRRFEDFKGADYLIMDVSLSGVNRLTELYPSAYKVYLEPKADPKLIYQTLMRRGQMSPQEARKRSSIIPSHIRDSKKMTFDKRIASVIGKYDDIALEILDDLPRNNPNPYYNAHMYASGSRDPFFPGDVPVAPPELLKGNPSESFEQFKQRLKRGKSTIDAKVSNYNTEGGDVIFAIDSNINTGEGSQSNRANPPKLTVRIQESTNPEKKLMAVFTKPNGRTKTTHFGARGMSDYTQHKDPNRKDNYLARHGGMGENWKDPTTAGALSRWILWGKPSLRESFNDYKKKFKIEGVMAVTNTRMNPSMDDIVSRVYRLSEKEKKTLLQRLVKLMEESGELAEEALIATGASGSAYKEAGKDGVRGETADAILILLSIYQQSGGSPQDLIETLDRKSQKWESKMNPKAPGYNSYAWTTQDWRSIKVNNKGEVDYAKKCGAEDTQVADGTPRLCLPAEVVRTLMKSKNGKEILLTQARKKARASKGQRVPWHPRIKEIWKRVEDKTVKDRPNPNRGNLPFRPTSDCFLLYNGKLVAQDMGHYIAFPGGGVDPGEEPIEAATRELMEEVGAILKEPMKSLGEVTWVWNPEWADTPKRQKRYQQFQGERVYFFTGEVDRFVGATSDEGDAWEGNLLMDIQDAIDYLHKAKANLEYNNQEKYIDYQIECLEELKPKSNPPIPFGPRPNPAWRHGKAMSEEDDPFASMFTV